MAESLLLPLVRSVTGKARDALVRRVTRMWGVDDDRNRLESQLRAVQSVLPDAELKSQINPAIKRWMKDLRAMAYNADDVLDDFQYEELRRNAQIRESMTHRGLLLRRLTLSAKLKDVIEKIDKLVAEMNEFGLVARAKVAPVIHRRTNAFLPDWVVGRDDDKEVVVELLMEQHDKQKVEVLPIIGMGGLGKTTLAQLVYNDARIRQHFKLLMWLCVSEEFNVMALVRSIIGVNMGRCDLHDNIELLGEFQRVIGKKRYLLILDDVWNEDEQKLEELKTLLCSVGGSGSVIVVTSRSQRVASIMGTLPCHDLSDLTEDESWILFSENAFSKGVEKRPEFIIIGKSIVKKCKGSPLALKVMGGLMSCKYQVHEWKSIAEGEISDNNYAINGILPILELSYRDLSYEMKQCFAFCAVFPRDYEMEKNMLIQLWIANDFIKEEEKMDFEHKGEFIFNELVGRSFLIDVQVQIFYDKPDSILCKMHDLMYDLAKSITDECVHIHELSGNKASMKDVRHMMSSVQLEETRNLFKDVAPLRTLLLPSQYKNVNIKSLNLLSLRVLCCSSLTIQGQLINAKHLRYLDLSTSDIMSLPDSICVLYNLQTLRLNNCGKLRNLPQDMRYMSKLRHLYLFGCDMLECMPPSIGSLINLRTLTTFIVGIKDGHGIEELKDMQHLDSRLELHNLRKIKNASDAKEANLHLKQNINELVLSWDRYWPQYEVANEEEVLESLEEEVLNSLVPHRRLKLLGVYGFGGTKISLWMKDFEMLQCLKVLHMSNCQNCKDLPTVWQLHSLEDLELGSMDSLTTLCNDVNVEADGYSIVELFPNLKKMCLWRLQNLERWATNKAGELITSVIFPEIQVLAIGNCPKLASIPDTLVLTELDIRGHCKVAVSSFAHLVTLSYLRYDNAGVRDSLNMQVIPFSAWPYLKRLHLCSWENMIMFPEEQQRESPLKYLRSLTLEECTGLFAPNLSKATLGFWKYFVFVEYLEIRRCDDLGCWPEEELQSLNHLQSLQIIGCKNLTGSSSEKTLLPASLEELQIDGCSRLVSLPSNIENLTKLRVLKVYACPSLRRLPDGMDDLSALQQLEINQCPGIATLPEGLLQRLPTFIKLKIMHCPELQRRCRRGGEYWDFVSPIRDIDIGIDVDEAQQLPNMKGFVRRFLPTFYKF